MVKDIENGDVDFELAWIGLMKILGKLMELRMDLNFREADKGLGTSEVVAKGNMLRGMLGFWEMNLPLSFLPIDCPDAVKDIEANSRTGLQIQPVFYRSLKIAVALGTEIFTFTF